MATSTVTATSTSFIHVVVVVVECDVSDAQLKSDFVYWDVTKARITYRNREVSELLLTAVAEDTREQREFMLPVEVPDCWQSWQTDLVDLHRPAA
nr:hypothetical protein OG690_38010 [Streptomyces tubercidicus]